MPAKDPAERRLIALKAISARWAKTSAAERRAALEKAQRAALDRFEREVDPDYLLPAAERAFRASHARKAYFTGLALKSVQARRRRSKPRSS